MNDSARSLLADLLAARIWAEVQQATGEGASPSCEPVVGVVVTEAPPPSAQAEAGRIAETRTRTGV